MCDSKLTRNQRYEKKMKAKGLVKRTVWVPQTAEVELRSMCEFLCSPEGKDQIPFMVRSLITGRMKKAV